MKHITKFLKLLKNPNYRKKISKHVERNICKSTKVYIQFCIKKEKNKQTKYKTDDQVADMQAVNFVLMKHN